MMTAAVKASRPYVSPWTLAIAALVILFVFIGARWVWIYRYAQPLDIDEAGYLSIALADYGAWTRGGFTGWLDAVSSPSAQAPLTTILASVVFILVGPHVIAGFALVLVIGALCIIATYMLGAAAVSRPVGLLAALLLASCPVIVQYSRSFHFSMPATLVMTISLLAIIRSDQFRKIGWAILFGICVGLMPLARTMAIAFVPGVLAGALISLVADTTDLKRRSLIFSGSVALAAVTAASWLASSWRLVFGYLFSFGYGNRALEYGDNQSKFGWDAWLSMLQSLCTHNVDLLHFAVLTIGLICALAIVLLTLTKNGPRAFIVRAIRSSLLPISIASLEAILALTSSQNKGSAFFAPVVPALLVIACWAIFRLSRSRVYRSLAISALVAVAFVAGASSVDLRSWMSRPLTVDLPLLGGVPVTDGRGSMQGYEDAGGFGGQGDLEPIPPSEGRKWVQSSAELAVKLASRYGKQAAIVFGFRNHLVNVNTVNLEQLIDTGLPFAVSQVEPTVTGDSVADYKKWLDSVHADTCALLISDITAGEFNPPVSRAHMEDAARDENYIIADNVHTPDGGSVSIWQQKTLPRNCHP